MARSPRGYIRERRNKEGKIISYTVSVPAAPGSRERRTETVKGTRREAEKVRTRMLREFDTQAVAPTGPLTVEQYLQQWLREYVDTPGRMSPQTQRGYRRNVEVHIIPALGKTRLDRLAPLQIQSFYTRLQRGAHRTAPIPEGPMGLAEAAAALGVTEAWVRMLVQRGKLTCGVEDGEWKIGGVASYAAGRPTGLSGTTALQIHHILHRALKQAVRWRLLAVNPADSVEPPKADTKERPAFDAEQAKRFLVYARDYSLFVPVALAVYAGLRRGEVFGLRWSDVDLAEGTLRVEQTLDYNASPPRFGKPKSQRSRRATPIAPPLAEILRLHKEEQAALRRHMGKVWQDYDLVCCLDDGRPVCFGVSTAVQRICAAAGVPEVRFHDLRHSFASLVLGTGASVRTLADLLGHQDPGFTLRRYGHSYTSQHEDAARKLGDLLG